MNQILQNLHDPSWWVTGLFFSALLSVVKIVVRNFPLKLQKLNKNRKIKRLLRIKSLRVSQSSIMYEIAKANSYFIVFVIVCCLFLFWFVSGPLDQIAKESKLAAVVLSSPIYIIEVFWLIQDKFTKDLIEHSKKLYKPVFLYKK